MTPVDAMIKISEVLMVLLLILGIVFGSPIVILLALFGMHEDGAAADWEASERNKERRHKEYMEEVKRHNKSLETLPRRRTRTIARDEHGRFIAQEIEEYE